jgi:hypothetical protein
MKMKTKLLLIATLLLISSVNILCQTTGGDENKLLPLKGKHSISFNAGLLNQQTATVYTVGVNAELNIMGALYYNYWFNNEWALEVNAGILNAEVFSGITLSGLEQKAATVVPILAGARYYPAALAIEDNVRPYIAALIGVHMGHSSSNKVLLGLKIGSETKVQSVFASKVVLGVDAFLGGWVRLGLFGGYNFGTDFTEPVGTRLNYSGIDFGLTFGIML